MGSAQQRPPFGFLEVGKRECGVAVKIHLAVEQERLARRALTLFASVHEHEPLLEGCVQDRLVLVDLDLETDWLEANGVGSAQWLEAAGPPARLPVVLRYAAPAGRPAGPPRLYSAMCASRSSGDIWLRSTLGL